MATPLEKLVANLKTLKILPTQFENIDADKMRLLKRKGVFPYDYISSWVKLNEEELPAIGDFFNNMTMSDISEEDYDHAKNVWQAFEINTLGTKTKLNFVDEINIFISFAGGYSDHYLKTDVLLLADVFECFRDTCLQHYGLDPAHYYTIPGLSWDAMLKLTDVQLELIADIDMLLFVEKGIRGGLAQCSKRYAKANNRYMENYNDRENSNYLMYYDINAMYAWAMTQYMPYGGLKWITNVDELNYNVPDNNPVGYMLEVDLEYPTNLHDSHSDLPLAIAKEAPPNSKKEKLMATLHNKQKYVIHYRNLKMYIEEGMILKKIHRAIEFQQSDWLESYITLNANLRNERVPEMTLRKTASN